MTFTTTLDRDAGEEKVWGDRMKKTWMRGKSPPETHSRETDTPGSISLQIILSVRFNLQPKFMMGGVITVPISTVIT